MHILLTAMPESPGTFWEQFTGHFQAALENSGRIPGGCPVGTDQGGGDFSGGTVRTGGGVPDDPPCDEFRPVPPHRVRRKTHRYRHDPHPFLFPVPDLFRGAGDGTGGAGGRGSGQ